MISFLHESILSSRLQKLHKRKLKKNLNYNLQVSLRKTLDLFLYCTGHALLCCSAGVFIGDGRCRVPVQLLHESRYSLSSIWPRKRGFGRVFAAKYCLLATRFRAWPPLIRPSGFVLLDLAYRLFILNIRDNLGSKLP